MSPAVPDIASQRRERKAIRSSVAVGLVAMVVFGLVLANVPSAQYTFAGQVKTLGTLPCGFGCLTESGSQFLPREAIVTLSWTDVSGGVVEFMTWFADGPWTECGNTATSGGCQFLSQGGNYSFSADDATNQSSQFVNYTGTY